MTPAIHLFFGKKWPPTTVLRVVTILITNCIYVHFQSGFAQVCASRSADFVINESFGTVNQQPNLVAQTTYQRCSSVCPDNGQYKLADKAVDTCFNHAWHRVMEDHTLGDANGNMLIVNASSEAGTFYQQLLTGLCGTNQYEFSVWGLNLLKPGICGTPTLPNLTIRIETQSGQVLQTINFGSMDLTQTPAWRRFSTLFTAPATTEPVVVKLINNQGAGGCGNDLALDDIQLKACGECPSVPALVPDAFTPNDDGINDRFTVLLNNAVSFAIRIYDRWGSVVFVSNALAHQWDGSYANVPCAAGNYSWHITYQLVDSENVVRSYTRTGQVLLLR